MRDGQGAAGQPPDRWQGVLPLAVFTIGYLVLALGLAGVQANYEFVIYIGTVVIFALLIVAMHRQVGLTLPLLWGLSLWGFAHMCGGLVPVPPSWPIHGEQQVLYSLWLIPDRLKYDHLVHAFGFGVTAGVCWQGLRAALGGRAEPSWGKLLLVWAAAQGFGAINEVVEFVAVLAVPETNVGGYTNTGWDLVANLVGSTVAVLIIRWRAGSW